MGGGSGLGPIINPEPTGYVDMTGQPATKGCGNGMLTSDEACAPAAPAPPPAVMAAS